MRKVARGGEAELPNPFPNGTMVQTCQRCARVNPPEALYCYFDGSILNAHGANGGPIHTGTRPFPHHFTFPSGPVCQNFDQLTLACQENWAEAGELLRQGYLENFLAGLGRADLAQAARDAAQFPDPDYGLDQFLAKLPSEVSEPPKLRVEPTEVHLGQLRVGEDREIRLHLTNQGMRLLHGSVACADCVWLGVGEKPGAPQKLFQFGGELSIPIQVRGQQLRAENKPLEGRLLIESNGGTTTVIVRAEVPVKPFPDGIFVGARTPRQIADKAKAHLKVNLQETATPFENGSVAQWYRDNGWTYPVRGPVAEGAPAVQQFFDALGLSRPPHLELGTPTVLLQGNVGVELRHTLELRAQERRPLYAHVTSDQPWLEVGHARFDSRTATLTLPLVVPSVPDHEGETLTAKVAILANGNQRFTVPVTLEVGCSFNFPPVSLPITKEIPSSISAPLVLAEAKLDTSVKPAQTPSQATPDSANFKGKRWLHAIPVVLLVLALSAVVVYDRLSPRLPSIPPDVGDGADYWGWLEDPEPRIGIKFNDQMRFGIVMLKEDNPDIPGQLKRLTAKMDGSTNNTCVRIDGNTGYLFGQSPGQWDQTMRFESLKQVPLPSGRKGWTSTWKYTREDVRVRQTVEIVPNEQTRLLDTCLVHYLIVNHDTIPHKVGIRVLVDTFIGSTDAAPFVIPGYAGLLETKEIFDQEKIPDYVEALERPNPATPGAIAHLGLKLRNVRVLPHDPALAPLDKLVICRWPGVGKRWQWEFAAINDHPPEESNDSCVVLYWDDRPLAPGAKRALAFTYGLGRIASDGDSQLGISVGGPSQPGKEFTIMAYVKDPKEGQKIQIHLPRGLSLAPDGDQRDELDVAKEKEFSHVSWRVRADAEGTYDIKVSSALEQQNYKIRIRKPRRFN